MFENADNISQWQAGKTTNISQFLRNLAKETPEEKEEAYLELADFIQSDSLVEPQKALHVVPFFCRILEAESTPTDRLWIFEILDTISEACEINLETATKELDPFRKIKVMLEEKAAFFASFLDDPNEDIFASLIFLLRRLEGQEKLLSVIRDYIAQKGKEEERIADLILLICFLGKNEKIFFQELYQKSKSPLLLFVSAVSAGLHSTVVDDHLALFFVDLLWLNDHVLIEAYNSLNCACYHEYKAILATLLSRSSQHCREKAIPFFVQDFHPRPKIESLDRLLAVSFPEDSKVAFENLSEGQVGALKVIEKKLFPFFWSSPEIEYTLCLECYSIPTKRAELKRYLNFYRT